MLYLAWKAILGILLVCVSASYLFRNQLVIILSVATVSFATVISSNYVYFIIHNLTKKPNQFHFKKAQFHKYVSTLELSFFYLPPDCDFLEEIIKSILSAISIYKNSVKIDLSKVPWELREVLLQWRCHKIWRHSHASVFASLVLLLKNFVARPVFPPLCPYVTLLRPLFLFCHPW